MTELSGLLGLMVFLLELWAIVAVVASDSAIVGKVLWVLIVLLLPVVGFLIWLIAGPRPSRRR